MGDAARVGESVHGELNVSVDYRRPRRLYVELAGYVLVSCITLLFLFLVLIPFYVDSIYRVENYQLYGVVVPPSYPLYQGQSWNSPVWQLASLSGHYISCLGLPSFLALFVALIAGWSRSSLHGKLLRVVTLTFIGLVLATYFLSPYRDKMDIWIIWD